MKASSFMHKMEKIISELERQQKRKQKKKRKSKKNKKETRKPQYM